MKPISPHDPLDDLIAAALHGDLTPGERTHFESRLSNDPAAQAAYQKAQAMHDLLEKNYQAAQPDPAFEQRMVSAVRRKLQTEQHRETAWESLLVLWAALRTAFRPRFLYLYGGLSSVMLVLVLGFVIYNGSHVKSVFTTISSQLAMASNSGPSSRNGYDQLDRLKAQRTLSFGDGKPPMGPGSITLGGATSYAGTTSVNGGKLDLRAGQLSTDGAKPPASSVVFGGGVATITNGATTSTIAGSANTYAGGTYTTSGGDYREPATLTVPQGGTIRGSGFVPPAEASPSAPVALNSASAKLAEMDKAAQDQIKVTYDEGATQEAASKKVADANGPPAVLTKSGEQGTVEAVRVFPYPPGVTDSISATTDIAGQQAATTSTTATAAPAAVDDRKLIRNAQLDLEVKSFQSAMDQIVVLTKAAGGYVDTSNSQKGGNGKLQGTVVVKVMPQNLDAFLLKLRDLGQVNNQSVSTDDVTKDYFDTQARLANSRRMEEQLQELLKHANSKVADLLQVERELGRVRGEIEQMQGQLKLYDFQVQYATVTMQMREKDLNQTAAYLLKEQDEFSLFATDVEGTFQKARTAADQFKTQVLVANLIHNSGSDVAAELTVMVAPDQVESFLAQVRGLGRVANFTRQTQRVAKDGGDDENPADQTLTEKDKVQVHLSIHSDDETRKQVALTVVTKAVDNALDQAKAAALANAGVEVLSSSLNKTPQGQSTAQLSVRVPGKDYSALIAAFNGLGRTASLSIQRNDNSGPGANGDDAPVIVSLALTDEDSPLQQTDLAILASDVDGKAQQIKKDATAAGVEVKASSFERQPDGTEMAQMTFRLPMSKYSAFVETVKNLGKVQALTVRRDDRPDQTRTDDTAPAEINLQLHNQGDIVADDRGLWATLRQTFGDGMGALFASVRVIGVIIAFTAPWLVTLVLFAWAGRRIYIWRKNR